MAATKYFENKVEQKQRKSTKPYLSQYNANSVKGAFSGLRQFLASESTLKIRKNTFYFTLKVLFVRKISKFLSQVFGHV